MKCRTDQCTIVVRVSMEKYVSTKKTYICPKVSQVPILYMLPVTLLCSLSNLAVYLTLNFLCLNSFILLMNKLHCVRTLS